MADRLTRILRISALAGFLTVAAPVCAQTGNDSSIIADKELDKADVATLQAEAELLETIRKGITLTLALCEPGQACTPSVNRDELHRIIEKVGKRIDVLTARHSETNDAALEPVMLAYVDVRDNYTKVLEQLTALVPVEKENAAEGGLPSNLGDVFKDADQALGDDDTSMDSFESGTPQ